MPPTNSGHPQRLMWFVECPNDDQGLVAALRTADGTVVLMCDSGGEVWLRPQDVLTAEPHEPESPDWSVGGISVKPGSTHWATAADVQDLDWEVEWHRLT